MLLSVFKLALIVVFSIKGFFPPAMRFVVAPFSFILHFMICSDELAFPLKNIIFYAALIV